MRQRLSNAGQLQYQMLHQQSEWLKSNGHSATTNWKIVTVLFIVLIEHLPVQTAGKVIYFIHTEIYSRKHWRENIVWRSHWPIIFANGFFSLVKKSFRPIRRHLWKRTARYFLSRLQNFLWPWLKDSLLWKVQWMNLSPIKKIRTQEQRPNETWSCYKRFLQSWENQESPRN